MVNDLQVLAGLREYRKRLNAADDWDLTDEGTWEEYAKPGGCHYGAIGAMRAYMEELEVRVDALCD